MYHEELKKFPENFLWGAASAAYQIEGAATLDGKGPSIWDEFSKIPGKTFAGTNGDVAIDHYHHYKEDVALMKELELKTYRFSVSWSRILPNGSGEVNAAGLKFYENLIDELLENKIEPVLTLYHWDLPQTLQDNYNGWEGRETITAFLEYCEILFDSFGKKVKYWVTFNEQNVFTSLGYRWAGHPPMVTNLKRMYAANHLVNLANARAIKLFHQKVPQGFIGPSFGYGPIYPATSNPEDVLAAENADSFNNRWWMDVYCHGRYPKFALNTLKKFQIAPTITAEDELVLQDKDSHPDFLGINYYHGGTVAQNRIEKPTANQREFSKTDPYLMQEKDLQSQNPETLMFQNVENPYLKKTDWGWEIDPVGFRVALRRVYAEYNLPLFITENGLGAKDELTEDKKVHDSYRINYLQTHLVEVQKAISDGVDIIGYCAWSFSDLLSWLNGYQKRYGFVYVDRNDQEEKNLERIKKDSFYWYQQVIQANGIDFK
ncbi:glycoside hydrolase family 1 protein [Enterococcus timonensis]|uniref:glycoside hydrolase family 1 protein n=1 Tax=Enterococcus timonensis TaxID=1852364 RepID=UPI0008DAA657|nr:glycoside hydrolase family 1 protein [Enterococcus timonensis]